MSARPKRHSPIARRAFLVILLSAVALLGGLAALGYWAYLSLDALLSPLLGAPAWTSVQNITVALAIDLAPYAVALLVGALLLAWLLARWVARPLNRLLDAIAAPTGAPARDLPVRAAGEIGQVARRFDELSKALEQAAREKEAQSRSSDEVLRRLEGVLQVERELNATLDAEHLTRRVALALRSAFGYERAGLALIEGETLAYYF
ncbi:MAG TPA: HAMP domain-containing protein, partial [Roseiflexaceae bacterium]